jgi:TetR/AcrR family transcriptional regulator, transcriptional repressor for nem operon
MDAETKNHILDAAQDLVQQRGFHAFSYRDIALIVGIKAPSIHYHFPAKEDLGVALVERYRQTFTHFRAHIDRQPKPSIAKLSDYADLFKTPLHREGKMCLCGMLAAEFSALPTTMQVGVRGFFDDNEFWLSELLDRGREQGELCFLGSSQEQAQTILSLLEGAMLSARVSQDVSKFEKVIQLLKSGLQPPIREP